VDPGFGPLIPLCRELRTEAGPIDVAYIDTRGQLILVETKLWRNNEARRKVIAQVLDYARALKRWTYADLLIRSRFAPAQCLTWAHCRRWRGPLLEG
jgi:RecB family endonuclease NucS